MKCRRLKTWTDENGKKHTKIVWFGSYGQSFTTDFTNEAECGKAFVAIPITQETIEQLPQLQEMVDRFHLSVPCTLISFRLNQLYRMNLDFHSSNDNDRRFAFTFNYSGPTISDCRLIIGYAGLDYIVSSDTYTTFTSETIITMKQLSEDEDNGTIEINYILNGIVDINTSNFSNVKCYHIKGSTNFFNENNKHDNFSEKQQAIVDSLIQHLSIIKNELWFNMNYGLPLTDKIKRQSSIDAKIIDTILANKEVVSIANFSSKVENHHYTCKCDIQTIYGPIPLNI